MNIKRDERAHGDNEELSLDKAIKKVDSTSKLMEELSKTKYNPDSETNKVENSTAVEKENIWEFGFFDESEDYCEVMVKISEIYSKFLEKFIFDNKDHTLIKNSFEIVPIDTNNRMLSIKDEFYMQLSWERADVAVIIDPTNEQHQSKLSKQPLFSLIFQFSEIKGLSRQEILQLDNCLNTCGVSRMNPLYFPSIFKADLLISRLDALKHDKMIFNDQLLALNLNKEIVNKLIDAIK